MPTDVFIVIGGGGHASVVVDAWLRAGGTIDRVQVFDDNRMLAGSVLDHGIRIQSPMDWAAIADKDCHVAIGDNGTREKLLREITAHGGRARTVAHPLATIASSARIGEGSFAAAGAIIAPRAEFGRGAIINHAAVVDHDCSVGAASHVAPGAILGGGVHLAARVLVGAGAVILPGLRVGDDAVIGAGAVVTRDIPAGQTVAGVPARNFFRHE